MTQIAIEICAVMGAAAFLLILAVVLIVVMFVILDLLPGDVTR